MGVGTASQDVSQISVGDELPAFELNVTAAVIVAGAIASRDFMPAHHDRDYATGQGAPDIFMNILTTNGYVARFVTDWAGAHAMIRRIAIRLGAPAVPGSTCPRPMLKRSSGSGELPPKKVCQFWKRPSPGV